MVPALIGIVALAAGIAIGFVVRKTVAGSNAQSAESRAQKVVLEAEREAETLVRQSLQEVKTEIAGMRKEAEEDVRMRREELVGRERRLTQAEEQLERKLGDTERRTSELEDRDAKLHYVREQLEKATEAHRAKLDRTAAMTADH